MGQHHRRRRAGPPRDGRARSHAFATPLVTKADGTKYGKTEGGALWLDPDMLSPYAFHQFWLNVEDEKVGELLRIFTFLPREEIEALEARHAEKPFLREAQKTLADEVTTFVHGAEETEQAKAAAAALFGGGDLAGAPPADPRCGARRGREHCRGALRRGSRPRSTCSSTSGLASSKGDARRTVGEGGAYVNNERVDDPEASVAEDDLIDGAWLVLRRGKKKFAGIEIR